MDATVFPTALAQPLPFGRLMNVPENHRVVVEATVSLNADNRFELSFDMNKPNRVLDMTGAEITLIAKTLVTVFDGRAADPVAR